MMKDVENSSKFLFYKLPDGKHHVSVVVKDASVWATRKDMGEILGVDIPTINYHLKEMYKSGELPENGTMRKKHLVQKHIVQKEDERIVQRELVFYNLDVILSVGYRVNSQQATQFRIWATKVLKEYLIKGFALDDQRLKQGLSLCGKDYFKELVERVRAIRTSEHRFCQKLRDLFAQCNMGDDPQSLEARRFYERVRNKLYFAVTGHTAAEIIGTRANHLLPNMGLQTWKGAPAGKINRLDIFVAQNYLYPSEIKSLNRLLSMYLDFAENQVARRIPMTIKDWVMKLDVFLSLNEYAILKGEGKVRMIVANALAEAEFKKLCSGPDCSYQPDFDGRFEASGLASLPLQKQAGTDYLA